MGWVTTHLDTRWVALFHLALAWSQCVLKEVGESRMEWEKTGRWPDATFFRWGASLKANREGRGVENRCRKSKQRMRPRPNRQFFFSCPTKTDMIEAEHEVETEFESNWKLKLNLKRTGSFKFSVPSFGAFPPPPSTDHLQNKRDLDINQPHHPTPHPPHPPQPPQPWPSQASSPPSAPTSSTPSPSTPSSPPSNP